MTESRSRLHGAKKYVGKMPPAVAGESGHDRLFHVACIAVDKFKLNAAESWEVLLDYNTRCQPPWTKPELIHKLADAFATIGISMAEDELYCELHFPTGYLPGWSPGYLSPYRAPLGNRKKQNRLPVLDVAPVKADDIAALAKLRGIPPEAIQLVASKHFLWRACWHGIECFALLDKSRRLIEVRRVDGTPFPAVADYAFAEIVQRHINLVYSVALRFTGNGEDAQDVAQAVFVILARKAAGLRPKTIVSGWLYETTRFTAMNFLTKKCRRRAREQEAFMQSTLNNAETERIWQQLSPLLEGAMTQLSEKERTLVVLRFFENKSIAETAVLMGIKEWAARKRVERTMEKLRAYLFRRGITSTTATIAGAISANSVHAAPVTLAKGVTAAALTNGATAGTLVLNLVKGALKTMAWSKAQTAIVLAVTAILTVSTTTLIVRHNYQAGPKLDFPRSSWRNAGYADPVSALETVFWAASQGDGKVIFDSLSADLQQKWEQTATRAGISPDQLLSQSEHSSHHLDGITGFRFVRSETLSSNEVRAHLSMSGAPGEQVFTVIKVGNEWKLDAFPQGF